MIRLNYYYPDGNVVSLNESIYPSFDEDWVSTQASINPDVIFFYTIENETTDIWEKN